MSAQSPAALVDARRRARRRQDEVLACLTAVIGLAFHTLVLAVLVMTRDERILPLGVIVGCVLGLFALILTTGCMRATWRANEPLSRRIYMGLFLALVSISPGPIVAVFVSLFS